MKTFLTLSLIAILIQPTFADDIYLKTGFVLKNVSILDAMSGIVTVQTAKGNRKIPASNIFAIIHSPFDPLKESEMLSIESSAPDSIKEKFLSLMANPIDSPIQRGPIVQMEYPNMKFLPLTILGIGLAWDYFKQASNTDDAIEVFKKIGFDTGNLENEKTRKQILAWTFTAASFANLFVCFHAVEVNATPQSISVAYHF